MKLRQIRNATVLLDYGDRKILVDPMLSEKGKIPSLKYLTKSRKRNPLVDLPPKTEDVLKSVTHVLITHCQKGHFDHLDRAAIKWIRKNDLPVLCSLEDSEFLRKLGLKVQVLYPGKTNYILGFEISLIPCVHGRGIIGSLMAHGFGYVLKTRDHPDVYVVGDSLRTQEVNNALKNHSPEVVIMPGGGAQFDLGGEIIMGLNDVIPMASAFPGTLVVNHLEALDHCPVTREHVIELSKRNKLHHRIKVPLDGEVIEFE